MLMRKISEIIRDNRLRKGYTQQELAKKLGVSEAYISKLERGGNPPSNMLALKLAEKLDIDEKKFLYQVLQERSSVDLRAYIVPNENPSEENLSEEVKEIQELCADLNDDSKQMLKLFFSMLREYQSSRKD